MAIKSLLIRDMKKLSNQLDNAINYIDIDYNIIDPGTSQGNTHTRTTIVKENYAILNAYRLWLQSKKYDYIRAPTFGGLFDASLNDRVQFFPENEDVVSKIIISETEQKWPDIEIIRVETKCNMSKRSWDINIVAKDKNSGLVIAENDLNIDYVEQY